MRQELLQNIYSIFVLEIKCHIMNVLNGNKHTHKKNMVHCRCDCQHRNSEPIDFVGQFFFS